MGHHSSLIAVRGRSKAEVVEALGFIDTGAPDPKGRAKVYAAEVPEGWTVVFYDETEGLGPRELAVVGAEAVGLMVNEIVMVSGAWGFRDGVERWAVLYDCEKGPDVEARGELPPAFAGIRAEALRETEEAGGRSPDYVWEVPALVVESVCGFNHEGIDIAVYDGDSFTALKRGGRPKRGGLLARLFGGR